MDLGVHHNTVAEAYRQLEQEGWLTLARRRGAIVQQRTQPTAAPDAKSSLDRKLRELAAHAISGGLSTTHVTEALFNAARDISSPARTQGELP
jgi:DNA-binding transcriptional regulator YhcF (GntR family)